MPLSHLDVLDVTRASVPASVTPGLWPCGSCRGDHPVEDQWVVTYRVAPFRDPRKTLVCDGCATRLREHVVAPHGAPTLSHTPPSRGRALLDRLRR